MIINCACYFSNMYVKKSVNKCSITIEYIFFIQLMYNKNDHLAKQSFLSDV